MSSNVLTPLQAEVLELLFAQGLGERGFFLSGGTALAEFYLQHRYSDDLDFFTRRHDSLEPHIEAAIRVISDLGFSVDRQVVGAHFGRLFIVTGDDRGGLKIEFVEHEGLPIAAIQRHGVVLADSFEDIAVNKICAIYDRFEPKDYVDLHFIVAESSFTVDYLLSRAGEKIADLEHGDGQLVFATNLLRVEELDRLTVRMIKPVSLTAMRDTLGRSARALIRQLGTAG